MKRFNLIVILGAVLLATLLVIIAGYQVDQKAHKEPSGPTMEIVPPVSEVVIPETKPPVTSPETKPETETETLPETETEVETKPTIPEPTPEDLLWEKRYRECPEATIIWRMMKEFGWTDAACAGIMGNIMKEVGGNTLQHINHTLFNSSGTHFGLCQWSARYYPAIQPTEDWMPSVEEQVLFLRKTIVEYNGHGFSYGFTEDYLKTATDPEEVARIFCEGYERPAGGPSQRMKLARIAYDYFTSEE